MDVCCDVRRQHQAAVRRGRERPDHTLDIGSIADRAGHKLDRESRRRCLGRRKEVVIRARLGIGQKCGARQFGLDLLEHR